MTAFLRFLAPLLGLIAWCAAGALPAAAQLPLPGAQPSASTTPTPDPLGRNSPRSAITGLISALGSGNYEQAGEYFDVPESSRLTPEKAAAAFKASLDAGGQLTPYAELSNDAEGRVDDALALNREQVGQLGGDLDHPIYLIRSDASGDAPAIWRVAPETVSALAPLREEASREMQEAPDGFQIAGAPALDWVKLLGIFLTAFVLFRLAATAILKIFPVDDGTGRFSAFKRFLGAALPPFSLLLTVILFQVWGSEAPASIVARQTAMRYVGIVAWIALAWFALRLVDSVSGTLIQRMERTERRQAMSVIALARRTAKALLLAVALIAILDTVGIDVTTGIAALGIGGLALALGAQKLIENLVGSVMVIADRPVQVGDFCQVGDVLGTVIDIGMRSTRLQTLERTVVTIPNGDFSSRQIENYATRDMFRFHLMIGLEYALSAARLREGIAAIEAVLADDPRVVDDPFRVKLKDFGPHSIDVEVYAYIQAVDYTESTFIRQDLLLAIYEALEQRDIGFAFPTRTLYLRPDQPDAPRDAGAKNAEQAPAG